MIDRNETLMHHTTKRTRATSWRSRVAAIAVAILTALGLIVGVGAPAQAYNSGPGPDFQVSTHVQGIGWTSNPGTKGQGLRLEAVKVTQLQGKVICLKAHVSSIGWQNGQCTSGRGTSITIGTTGRGLAIEAIEVWRPGNSYAVAATAHIQDIGDQRISVSKGIGGFTVGTTGRGLRMEWFELSNL